MQLGVVEAEIAPLHALAVRTGDEVAGGLSHAKSAARLRCQSHGSVALQIPAHCQ